MKKNKQLLVIIAAGKKDDGLKATLGYVIALNALAVKWEVTIFFTGEGAIWGTEDLDVYDKGCWGFPMIEEMTKDFAKSGGKEMLCLVCYKSCLVTSAKARPNVKIAGISSVMDIIMNGTVFVF